MINSIWIDGYKCLKDVKLDVSNLNVLVGSNASGKSSVLQIFLLLRQSANSSCDINRLELQGELFEAGLASEVLHPESDRKISIKFQMDNSKIYIDFYHDREAAVHARYLKINDENAQDVEVGTLYNKVPFSIISDDFIYLNAERISPKVFYPLSADKKGLLGDLGKHGEYTISYLAGRGSSQLIDGSVVDVLAEAMFSIDGLDLKEVLQQTAGRLDLVANEILGWIIPGAKFDVEESPLVDAARLQFIRDQAVTKTKVRPTHIGFGLTYSLPIITGALLMGNAGTLIVENPEAHLHPFSQSRIGVFLALMASTGRQIFIETHSDHVVNGIRLAVSKGFLKSEKLKTFFFERPHHGTTANVIKINCDSRGRMDRWPKGFFDQIETDLSDLG